MKKNTFLFLVFLMIIMLQAACSNDSDSEEKIIEPIDFTDRLTNWNWDKIESDRLYVIRSTEEYQLYKNAETGSLPDIDFTQYSLLVVKGEANRGIQEKSEQLIVSGTGNYLLDIRIKLNIFSVMEKWHIGVLVPVIPTDKNTDVEISYIPS